MLEDGKISKDDEMQKLPFVMLKLIAIGNDTVIGAFQKVYDAINNVFNNKPTEDEVLIKEDDRKSIMELLGKFANECRVDLGVSDSKVKPELFQDTQNSIEKSGELMNTKNLPLGGPVSHEAKVSIADGDFHIKRYETKHIRIFDDQDEICKSSKGILRKVNIEYNLGFIEDPDFKKKNTRAIGLEIIKKLNELGH